MINQVINNNNKQNMHKFQSTTEWIKIAFVIVNLNQQKHERTTKNGSIKVDW